MVERFSHSVLFFYLHDSAMRASPAQPLSFFFILSVLSLAFGLHEK